MIPKKASNIISTLDQRAKEAPRKCLFEGCNELAIASHLLQKRGIINQIAENNHVLELAFNNYKKEVFYFKHIGVNQAFAFPGFCSHHDNDLFKSIESGNVDYKDYRTQLLFSYRAVMNEKRKKEIIIDFYGRILNSLSLPLYLNEKYFKEIRANKLGQQDGIKDEKYYEQFFLSNIRDNSKKDFDFITFELPKMDVCSSAVFTYETTAELNHMLRFESYKRSKPLTEIYFNLLPLDNRSIVMLGCLSERAVICWKYIKSFEAETIEKCQKKISDLLLCQVENWLCSDSFYKSHLKARAREIVNITHVSLDHMDERRELDFNLFSLENEEV